MISGIWWIMSAVDPLRRGSPSTNVSIRTFWASSSVSIHGPIGAKVS